MTLPPNCKAALSDQLIPLAFFFALHAIERRRDRFQPGFRNITAAFRAFAEGPLLDELQGGVDITDPRGVTLVERDFDVDSLAGGNLTLSRRMDLIGNRFQNAVALTNQFPAFVQQSFAILSQLGWLHLRILPRQDGPPACPLQLSGSKKPARATHGGVLVTGEACPSRAA